MLDKIWWWQWVYGWRDTPKVRPIRTDFDGRWSPALLDETGTTHHDDDDGGNERTIYAHTLVSQQLPSVWSFVKPRVEDFI